jgi:hypothetical protein
MEWQPIETAPIGVDILISSNLPECEVEKMGAAKWAALAIGQRQIKTSKRKEFQGTVILHRIGNQLLKRPSVTPTHWMPLPSPPEVTA